MGFDEQMLHPIYFWSPGWISDLGGTISFPGGENWERDPASPPGQPGKGLSKVMLPNIQLELGLKDAFIKNCCEQWAINIVACAIKGQHTFKQERK